MKDGVVLAVEKLVHSKLLVPEANRRIQTIDKHIGLVCRTTHQPLICGSPHGSGYSRLPQDISQMVDISPTARVMRHPATGRTTGRLLHSKYACIQLLRDLG